MSSNRVRYRSARSRSGPSFNRPTTITTMRMYDVTPRIPRFAPAVAPKAPALRRAPRARKTSDRLHRRRTLRPQSLEIVEVTHLGSEDVHDHVAGIDQHPVAIGQALDMDAL